MKLETSDRADRPQFSRSYQFEAALITQIAALFSQIETGLRVQIDRIEQCQEQGRSRLAELHADVEDLTAGIKRDREEMARARQAFGSQLQEILQTYDRATRP